VEDRCHARWVRCPHQNISDAGAGAQPIFHQPRAFSSESLILLAGFCLTKQGARFLHARILRGGDEFLFHAADLIIRHVVLAGSSCAPGSHQRL